MKTGAVQVRENRPKNSNNFSPFRNGLPAKEVRDYLRATYQLTPHDLHALAYWKLGMNEETDHDLRHQESNR